MSHKENDKLVDNMTDATRELLEKYAKNIIGYPITEDNYQIAEQLVDDDNRDLPLNTKCQESIITLKDLLEETI